MRKELTNIECNISKKKWYESYLKKIIEKLQKNRKQIVFCFIVTFIWGLITHAYAFFHSSFSHDSLFEFVADESINIWRIQLGRIFVPIYRIVLRGAITAPWFIGILSLLYISIAVFLVTKIFDIKSKTLIILISGIFATNITVIATTATYIHDLDTDMMALLLSVFAIYLWKSYNNGFLYGIIAICLSIGFYQSYVSVAITLILLYLIMQLLNEKSFDAIFKKGLKSIVMLVSGGILYYILTKVICGITGISLLSGNYNSVDTVLSLSIPKIIYLIINGYTKTKYEILNVSSMYSHSVIFIVNIIMIVIAGIIILLRIFNKKIKIKEKILMVLLIILLPIGMNIVYPLTGGMSHDIMHYAIWMIYLFVLLITWWCRNYVELLPKPIIRFGQCFVTSVLVLIILCGNIQLANAAYLKKDLEGEANLSLFSRILYEMEKCDGYVTGETPVVFVGKPNTLLNVIPGFERTYEMTGSENWYVLGAADRDYYQAYFDYILLNPAVMAESDIWTQMQTNEKVKNMPYYPKDGSVAIIDDIIVIKLGE